MILLVEVPTLYLLWESVLGDLLDRTARFPKVVRFTFANRIENLSLDVLEDIVAARYAAREDTSGFLQQADGRLARLRVLVRLAHTRGYLDHRGYEHISRGMDEAGRMLGGWRRGGRGDGRL